MKKRILSLSGAIALSLMLASALFAGIHAAEFCDSLDLDSSARAKTNCATQIKKSAGKRALACMPGGGCDWVEDHTVITWGGKC